MIDSASVFSLKLDCEFKEISFLFFLFLLSFFFFFFFYLFCVCLFFSFVWCVGAGQSYHCLWGLKCFFHSVLCIITNNSRASHCLKRVRIWNFSGPYFPAFTLNTERCSLSLRTQSNIGKIRTGKTPNTDTFHTVSKLQYLF